MVFVPLVEVNKLLVLQYLLKQYMLTYEVLYNTCSECFSVSGLLDRVDQAIISLGRRMYKNRVLLLNKPLVANKIKILSYYKDILDNLLYNPFYYGPSFDYQRIDSRIKELINGLH